MNICSSRFLLSLLLFTVSITVQGQFLSKNDSIYHLSEVVISANRYETSLLSTASSVTVLDSVEIMSGKKSTVFDLLHNQPGLSIVQAGGPGKITTINMRGAGPGHTLVLLDGIEMNMPNDPSSVYDFANLPLNNIKRIEILRGPQSTLYGSDAMAGVINIITGEGLHGSRYFINAEGGKYNSFSGSAGTSGRLNKFDYNLSLSATETKGFSSASEKYGNTERDGAENKTISAKTGMWINDNIKFNLISRYTNGKADYDQFGGAGGDDPTYIFNLEEIAFRPEIQSTYGIWDQTIGFSFFRNLRKYSFDSTAAYGSFSNSNYDGKKFKIDWLNNIRLSDNIKYTIGMDIEKEKAESNYKEYNSFYEWESSFPGSEMNTIGMFAQNSVEPFTNTFFTWGIRYDIHNRFGSIITYRIAPVYYIESTATKLKATHGTGFKTPSLFFLYDPNFGNINLRPEKSTGWDIGFEQFFNGRDINFGVTYFRTDYEDLFGSDEFFRTININEAAAEGVESSLGLIISSNVILKLNYTYTKSRDKNPGLSEAGQKLIRRPDHKGGINILFTPSDYITLNLDAVYYGSRRDRDFSSFPAGDIELKPFTLVNLAASYKILSYLELYARAENVLNEEYEQVFGYASPRFGMYGGFRLNF